MVPKWVAEIAEVSRTLGLKPKVVRVRSAEASRELPTPYGMFCILYDGKLIADRPISARGFMSIMRRHSALAGDLWQQWIAARRFSSMMRKHAEQSPAGDVRKAAPEE
jgi:hypothetical protein